MLRRGRTDRLVLVVVACEDGCLDEDPGVGGLVQRWPHRGTRSSGGGGLLLRKGSCEGRSAEEALCRAVLVLQRFLCLHLRHAAAFQLEQPRRRRGAMDDETTGRRWTCPRV